MKVVLKCLVVLTVVVGLNCRKGKTVEKYIKEAEDLQKAGKLQEAIITLEEAAKLYPNNADAYAYLGLYTGMQAGETTDIQEAMRLVNLSFERLDKAVFLDSLNPLARFYRGIISMNVPEFFGKLESGIKDMEFMVGRYEQSTDKISSDMVVTAYELLAKGYQKIGDEEKAKDVLSKLNQITGDTTLIEKAKEEIKKISKTGETHTVKEKKIESAAVKKLKEQVKKEPNNQVFKIKLGKAYIDDGFYEEGENILRKVIAKNSTNVVAYKYLVQALEGEVKKGYDERIYENTDARMKLAFEIIKVLDKIVALEPEDISIRLERGAAAVEMPFFVGKLEQGIEDLNMVIKSDAPDDMKAYALYYLGVAYEKKAMTSWIKVVSKYPDSRASLSVFNVMKPQIEHIDLSKYNSSIVVIDFILGFRDELPPQSAVWVEDENGGFVKTIYVSGFSGYAKEKQVNLPKWSESSKFLDVDEVTGASIDLGHHIYVWDLKDNTNKRVRKGKYTVKVEVAYWPSMKYQMVSVPINVGNRAVSKRIEEGNFIPSVEVKYYPKGGKQ